MKNVPKLVNLTPWIYNVKAFYHRNHPDYHPDTTAYMQYWEEHERRSIEGFWGLDQQSISYNSALDGGWRFMTPQHYWYTNFCFIQHESDDSTVPETINPDCRDIDWYIFYSYFVAIGFSGFEKDTEVSCHYLLKKRHKFDSAVEFIESLTPKEKKMWSKIRDEVTKSNGEYKEYKDPLEYLKQTFSDKMGRAVYSNPMKNIAQLSSRGVGKSYSMMGILSQTFNFYGARTWEQYMNTNQGPTMGVGSALSSKSGELLSKFKFSQDQLVDRFGAYGDDEEFMPGFFHKETMGVMSPANEKNAWRHQYKIKVNGVWKNKGTRTKIIHQSYDGNPEVFVGQRFILLLEDELGLNSNLLDSAKADETTMIMKNKMGITFKSGTGGNIEKIQQSKTLFYDPDGYGYMRFDDPWEHAQRGIGMFIPAYYTDSSFRDENGNQDIEAAYEQEMHERSKRAEADNTIALDGYMVARPLVPSEMFLAPETNIFPISLIREHKADIEHRRVWESITSQGYLEYESKEELTVKWVNYKDKYRPAINKYDLKEYDGNISGTIVIYEHPVDNIPDPQIKSSLYKIGYDPVRDDFGGTSLASIKVYKGVTAGGWNQGLQSTVVAEYYGREQLVEDMHEIAIKLAMYYNAKILPETNIPDFLRYCKRRRKIHLLQPVPYDAISKKLHNPSRKYDYGMPMKSKELIIQGEQLLRQWLLEKRGHDKDGKPIYNLHHLYSLRLLDELCMYDRERNTDGISAMFLIMFWIYQETLVPIEQKTKAQKRSKINEYFKELTSSSESGNYLHVDRWGNLQAPIKDPFHDF